MEPFHLQRYLIKFNETSSYTNLIVQFFKCKPILLGNSNRSASKRSHHHRRHFCPKQGILSYEVLENFQLNISLVLAVGNC